MDRVHSTVPDTPAGLHLRPALRRGVPQTPDRRWRVALRLLHVHDEHREGVLAVPARARNRRGARHGHHVLAERVDAEPSFREEQVPELGIWRAGEWKQRQWDIITYPREEPVPGGGVRVDCPNM